MSEIKLAPSNPLIESDVYRPSKLSEAIRIGAKIRPQCRGEYFINGESCAIGAAIEATYGHTNPSEHDELDIIECYGVDKYYVFHAESLNDDHGYTREQVADWLESQGL